MSDHQFYLVLNKLFYDHHIKVRADYTLNPRVWTIVCHKVKMKATVVYWREKGTWDLLETGNWPFRVFLRRLISHLMTG